MQQKLNRLIIGLLAGLVWQASAEVQLKNKYAAHEPPEHINRDYPPEWQQLIPGGRFMDRFLPMPGKEQNPGKTWGVEAVQHRFVDNGMEDPDYFFWGGHITQAEDGHYRMYCSSFVNTDEKSKCITKIHRAVANNLAGPYKVVETLGWGHAPELQQTKDGKYFIPVYLTQPTSYGYYLSDSPEGPWTYHKYSYDFRDRKSTRWLQNNMMATQSFAKRTDGSFVAINKGGSMFISKDGLSTYRLVTHKDSAYPDVEARFEDPTIWRDNVQYHLVVNDWQGRVAWYLRSKDCISWVVDPGFAIARGAAYHPDGYVEDWCKFERFKVYQDEHGRAVQANMVGIDVPKNGIFTAHYEYIRAFDKPTMDTDGHWSKQLCIPLNPGMLMEWVGETRFEDVPGQVSVLIKKEPGFDPAKDVDVASLQFGANDQVNYGRGARAVGSQITDEGLVVTFNRTDTGITKDEFAPKVIGNDNNGQMIYGYTRVPWIDYEAPVMSPLRPSRDGESMRIVVENMGPRNSTESNVSVYVQRGGEKKKLGAAKVPAMKTYESREVLIVPVTGMSWTEKDTVTIEVLEGAENVSSVVFNLKETFPFEQKKSDY